MIGMTLALGVIATSCSDWDDHYDMAPDSNANATIWQNLQSNSKLSQFAALVKKAGYDQVLNGSRTLTVWAPEDGTFNYDSINAIDDKDLLNEFVLNHIANSNYPASGAINEDIHMLNKKVMNFSGSDAYTMDDLMVLEPNIASKNGVIHAISGSMQFHENVYESISPDKYPVDSFSAYFHKYDVKQLDEANSVPGPVVDGHLTYLDSVVNLSNTMCYLYSAYINSEDSSYTMILPTNTAWEEAITANKNYLQYAKSVVYHDPTKANSDTKTDTTYTYNIGLLQDSLSKASVLSQIFFNNNLYGTGGNQTLKNYAGGQLNCDSIVTTSHRRFYRSDANAIFQGATRLEKSNGSVWLADKLNFHPWAGMNPLISYLAINYLISTEMTAHTYYVSKTERNPKVSGDMALYVEVSNSDGNPTVSFPLRGARSNTTYNIYVVLVPANISDTTITNPLPNMFQASLQYNNAKGAIARKNLGTIRDNDVTKIDTTLVGSFEFPVSYVGLDDVYPVLTLQSRVTTSNLSKYDRTLRIGGVLLVPKELDDYIESHPDYYYSYDAAGSSY